MKLDLRTLGKSDAPMLALLEKECFSCPWSEESFYECLGNERFYFVGLFESDELIGYGGLTTVLDEATFRISRSVRISADRDLAKCFLTHCVRRRKNAESYIFILK